MRSTRCRASRRTVRSSARAADACSRCPKPSASAPRPARPSNRPRSRRRPRRRWLRLRLADAPAGSGRERDVEPGVRRRRRTAAGAPGRGRRRTGSRCAFPEAGARRRWYGSRSVPWWMRLLLWIVAVPLSFLLVFLVARAFGMFTTNQLSDVFLAEQQRTVLAGRALVAVRRAAHRRAGAGWRVPVGALARRPPGGALGRRAQFAGSPVAGAGALTTA